MNNKISLGIIAGLIAIILVLAGIVVYQNIEKPKKEAITGSATDIQKIIEEIMPRGIPEYGNNAGVSFDNVEQSLSVLVQYANLQLNEAEQQRYEEIASVEGTACSYCCGATRLDQNCGCSHNIALQGLVKWLIKNTNYSDEQILKEVRNWQIVFFPQPALEEELQKRNINPEAYGLPSMRGGC